MEVNGFLLIIFVSSKPQGHTSHTASVPANTHLNHGKATLLRSFHYWGPHFPFGAGFTPCELGGEGGGVFGVGEGRDGGRRGEGEGVALVGVPLNHTAPWVQLQPLWFKLGSFRA